LVRAEDGSICSVPEQWTDTARLDPELVIGEMRALFRVADLIELERLVSRLSAVRRQRKRKDNSAANVNKLTPRNG
jgi:hypothetical protein